MPAISEPMVRACYDAARDVHSKRSDPTLAIADVVQNTGMTSGSALDYVYNIMHMIAGESYTRTMNKLGTKRILEWIGEDFGQIVQRAAVHAVLAHVDYYAALPKGGLQRDIKAFAEQVIAKNLDVLNLTQSATARAEFTDQVARAMADTDAARRARLKDATIHPLEYLETRRAFRRNPDVVAERLVLAQGQCDRCRTAAPFKRPNGNPYLEVHHILPLAEGGADHLDNTLALCPNCHREAHHGEHAPSFRKMTS